MDTAGGESFNDEADQQSDSVDNDLIAIDDVKDNESGLLNVAAASVGELSTQKRGGLISRLFGGGRKSNAEVAQTQQLGPDTAIMNTAENAADELASDLDEANDLVQWDSEPGSDVPTSDAEREDAQDDDTVAMTSTNQTEQQISREGVLQDADIEPEAGDVEQSMVSASNDGGSESLPPPSVDSYDSSGSELSATIENQQGVGVGDSGSDKVISSKVKTYKPGTFDYQGDVVSGVRVSDRDEIVDRYIADDMSDSSEFDGQSEEMTPLESDDFDDVFSESDDQPEVGQATPVEEPVFDQSPVIVDTTPAPMVNPEELGLLKLFDDAEEPADAAARVVEAVAPVTDLKDELLGFEKFLEIQSTLVNKADGDDKSSLGLYNIDSSDVKFAIVSAYVEDGNVDGARDMLLEMVEQVDGAELARAHALLDTL